MSLPITDGRTDSKTILAKRQKEAEDEARNPSRPTAPDERRTDDEPIAAEAVLEQCPKCGEALVDPGSLGWCTHCGYCRMTVETPSPAAPTDASVEASSRPSPLGIVEAFRLLRSIPSWVWLWLWGIAAVIFVAIYGDMGTPDESRSRAVWCTAQIMLGLAALIAAQLWAAFVVAPLDDKIGMFDVIIPFRLWSVSVKRLPLTRWPICLASWAMVAMISAVILVGGLEYWLPKKPVKKAGHHALIGRCLASVSSSPRPGAS